MGQLAEMLQDTVRFFVYSVRATYRSLRDNKGLAAVSIVLAFGIWIAVTEADNPTRTSLVPYDLVVEPINVPPSVAVVEPIGGAGLHLRVRVAAGNDVFNSLRASDFQATVDLEGYTVGEYEKVPVHVRAFDGNVRVESVVPETITVQLAQLTSKQVEVTPEVTGAPLSGYTMSPPELDDTSVTVSGPQADVDSVTQVVAAIDVTNISKSDDQAVRLVARDAQGTLVPGVHIDPPITNAHIDVQQQRFSRSMAVSATITGAPKEGYNVVSVSVTPATVTVRGDEAFIAGTASIPTKPLNIDGATDDVVKTVSLDLPSGAEVTGSAAVVTVTVKISPATGVYNFSVPVTARNLGDDVAVNGALPSVIVTLFGPLPQLQALSPNDIGASVDLDGDGEGVHTVKIDVIPPEGTGVTQTNPAEIDVTLVKR
jgi:YbbR domain-containing protein